MNWAGVIGRGLGWIGIIVSLQAEAATPEECRNLELSWSKRYVDSFHVARDVEEFSCESQTGVLALTLRDLESLVFTPTSAGYRPNFYSFVTRNLRSLQVDPACKEFAYATRATGTLVLCPRFFEDVREERASTLVHEARHLEKGAPGHVTCLGGAFVGKKGSCDATFFDGQYKGSGYNLDVFFMNWVLKGANQNRLSQSVLQSRINAILPDRFNHVSPELLKKWRGV